LAAEPLGLPPAQLTTTPFPKTCLAPARLVRVSAYTTGEPYFGTSGANRFDAPGAAYAVCYLGTHLDVAIAESILHDEMPVDGAFQLTRAQIDGRHALYFSGRRLHVLDLSGPLLKRLGGSADLAGTTDYGLTQAWSQAVYANPARYDGFLYMSRHLNTRRALALFDRAAGKIALDGHAALASARGFRQAMERFNIMLV
jgi:CubicO group peptidase (beta-lactamase class C family)